MIDWTTEWPQIQHWSALRGVDPLFVAAIRHTENGGPGREFGVLDGVSNTYELQLRKCTRTIITDLITYHGPIFTMVEAMGLNRACYSPGFIRYVQQRYAPPQVANDPTNLNQNWFSNCSAAYQAFITVGHPA